MTKLTRQLRASIIFQKLKKVEIRGRTLDVGFRTGKIGPKLARWRCRLISDELKQLAGELESLGYRVVNGACVEIKCQK